MTKNQSRILIALVLFTNVMAIYNWWGLVSRVRDLEHRVDVLENTVWQQMYNTPQKDQ